ncbi:MAG: hypothetical protein JWO63_3361, partial [Frankiales bacterium]|nr:hypothetical protein [Frankiales bacterium]
AAPADSPQFWTAPPAWSAQPSPQPQAPQPNQQWDDLMSRHAAPPPSTSLLTRNRYTAITAGIAALYLVLAVAAHIALIGILPVVMSRRAFRAKEPLAIASAVIAGICLVLALASLIR